MRIEIINTGTEIMLGSVLNLHHQWLARQLRPLGYRIHRQVSVPDRADQVAGALQEALGRSELIFVTGGLGPTSDDLTGATLASLLKKKLVLNQGVLAEIKAYFRQRKKQLPPGVQIQAMVPEGARILRNRSGTAPGLIIETSRGAEARSTAKAWIILLPGPPRELHPMFKEEIIPFLKENFVCKDNYAEKTLRTTGIGESLVENKIAPRLLDLDRRGLEIGYSARIGLVDIRLSADGPESNLLIEESERRVRRLLGKYIYGDDDDTLESVVLQLLKNKRKTLALAESCTGGHIADRLTNVPGSSAVFLGSAVTYSNRSKTALVAVPATTLLKSGAVSRSVVEAMAQGALKKFQSDYSLAVNGIAGPDGGTKNKPVGTVFLGLAARNRGVRAIKKFNPYDRKTFKEVTATQALEWLRHELLRSGSSR